MVILFHLASLLTVFKGTSTVCAQQRGTNDVWNYGLAGFVTGFLQSAIRGQSS